MVEKNNIAVVIPFYQREKGILLRSVKSVLQQNTTLNYKIFIVDDGSPVKAKDDLSHILDQHSQHISIIEQDNAGPAKARNTAIIEARKEMFEFIAFLDSDDEWEPRHLETALATLGGDYDFYFSDVILLDGIKSVFESKDFPHKEQVHCEPLPQPNSFEYTGNLFSLILSGCCPIATPAVVFRASSFDFLFREDLTTAGEDYFFWCQVANQGKKITFSTYKGVKLNQGVNIYASVEWGTNESMVQIVQNWRYNHQLIKYFTFSNDQKKMRQETLRQQQKKFIENLVHILLHHKKVNWSVIFEYGKVNPEIIFLVPFHIIKTSIVKILTRLS